MKPKFLFPIKENNSKNMNLIQINSLETNIKKINLHEYKLLELSKKMDSLITLSNKIQYENEKTNDTMIIQYNNLQSIDSLIKDEIDTINQLSIEINTYKTILDTNIENFKSNKEKLLKIVSFINETKNYIFNLKDSSSSMMLHSNNILNISQTIKKISEHSEALSINSQIESAKISRNNNGFNFLSEEMARMAKDTKRNSILIDDTINIIINNIEGLNNEITENVNKIEESIVLCNIVVDFVESLNKEYTLNIMMFDRILDSMTEIILFIEDIKISMNESHYISQNVFKNTSSEYICIQGLLEDSLNCKNRTHLTKTQHFENFNVNNNDTLNVLVFYSEDFINNPLNTLYDDEKVLASNIFNTLFNESNVGTNIPSLAKGWTDENSKIWTIYLKNDIYFSNGDPVTAEDVEFSLIRSLVETSYSFPEILDIVEGHCILKSTDDFINKKISGIEVINNKTIRFRLKAEEPLFLNIFSDSSLFIVSKKEYIKSKKYIGSGAYYIDSIEKVNSDKAIIHLKANPYNKTACVYIKNVDLTMDKNIKAYVHNLANNTNDNTYDIIFPISYLESTLLKPIQDIIPFNILSENSYGLFTVNFIGTSQNKLIKNKDFRQSVFSLIKNMDLSINGLDDYYIKNNTISTRWINSGESLPNWLDKSPIINKFEEGSFLNIITYPSPLNELLCEKIQDILKEKGIKTKLHITTDYTNIEDYDLSIGIFTTVTNNFLSQLYTAISPPHGSCILDTPLGAKIEEIDKMSNYKIKDTKLKDIELEILKEYYNLPICYIKRYILQSKNLINLNTGNLLFLKFENILKKSNNI